MARLSAEPAGDGKCGLGVANAVLPVDPALGALAILVATQGGTAPTRGFTLSVWAEAPFDLRVATPGTGVSAPVAKVSNILPGAPDALPPVPSLG